MINIKIYNPELEREIRQSFGEDTHSLATEFVDFFHHCQIRQDIEVSIAQLDKGLGINMKQAITEVRAKH
jgi:hypothetical protein